MTGHGAAPVRKPLLTPGVLLLLGLVALGMVFAWVRCASGLGAVTQLDDRFP